MSQATSPKTTVPLPVIRVKPQQIVQSPLQVRTVVEESAIEDMRANFRARGFDEKISRLLLRPSPLGDVVEPKFEIVLGQCRWQAALAEDIECPAVVQELSDDDVLELMLIENIQRSALSPLEEAAGVMRLAGQTDGDGKRKRTDAELEKELGKGHCYVSKCRKLAGLRGTPVGEKIESGELSPRHGEIIASLPTVKMQNLVAGVALKGRHGSGPMSTRALEEYVREEYMTQLKGSVFDQADAELLPVETVDGERRAGGACADCPFNSANLPAEKGVKPGKFQMCMNTDCHARKVRAAYDQWGAKQTGAELVSYEDREGLLDYTGKRLSWNSGFIELDEKPAEHLLKDSVKNPPPWKKLIAGKGVPERIFKDDDGAVHRVASKALAIEAAKANGHRIFSEDEPDIQDAKEQVETEKRREVFVQQLRADPANADISAAEATAEFERLEKEREKQKAEQKRQKANHDRMIEGRLKLASGKALLQAARSQKRMGAEFWDLVMPPLVEMACESDDFSDLVQLFGVQFEGDAYNEGIAAFTSMVSAAPLEHLPAIALMLVSSMVRYDGIEAWQKKAFKTFGVDVKAAMKAEREAIAAEEAAAAEETEIATGLKWVTRREKATDFEWDAGFAVNPDHCEVALPAEVKADVSIFAARGKKGWRAGIKIGSKKHGDMEALMQDASTDYGTRELAITPQLQAAVKHFEKAKVPAAVARLEAYIARLTTPAEVPVKPAKGAKKKKGGSK